MFCFILSVHEPAVGVRVVWRRVHLFLLPSVANAHGSISGKAAGQSTRPVRGIGLDYRLPCVDPSARPYATLSSTPFLPISPILVTWVMTSESLHSCSDCLNRTVTVFDEALVIILRERKLHLECQRQLDILEAEAKEALASRPRVSLGFGYGDDDESEDAAKARVLINTISLFSGTPVPTNIDDATDAVQWAGTALQRYRERVVEQTRIEKYKHMLTSEQVLKAMHLIKSLTDIIDTGRAATANNH